MSDLNRNLSRIFKDMSAIYQYLGGEERFRALAYLKASRVLSGLPQDITSYIQNNDIKGISGIGEHIAEKIIEYTRTGKIGKYEELKKEVPYELMEMEEITGFGPAGLRAIHDQLKINTRGELMRALEDGRISKLKGFGEKKVASMMRGLKLHKTVENRMLLWNALELSEKVAGELKDLKEVKQIEVAGSLRRKKETIGDIDVLVTCAHKDREMIVKQFTASRHAASVLAKGDTKASIILKDGGRQVDLRIVEDEEWGSALLYFTGSKEHTIKLRTIAKERGLKISEYGVFRIKDEKCLASKTEEEIYKLLGFAWVPPEMREDRGELELAARNKLPRLIELKDMRGDLHMHSKWSDGMHSIEDLGLFAMKNYNYDYIALTDHSKSERQANGMDEKGFLKQIKAVEEANKKLGRDFIKTGTEVDILNDGNLDLSNELLGRLDWVNASIHAGFSKDNTDRLIKACENPFVTCIGHPSGRLIGKREEYQVNWSEVFKAAAATGTAMEINCQPQRMDLNDEHAMAAREAGVKLVISTDMHNTGNFAFMKLGVYMARRAWCAAADVLNTSSWKEVQAFANRKRKKK